MNITSACGTICTKHVTFLWSVSTVHWLWSATLMFWHSRTAICSLQILYKRPIFESICTLQTKPSQQECRILCFSLYCILQHYHYTHSASHWWRTDWLTLWTKQEPKYNSFDWYIVPGTLYVIHERNKQKISCLRISSQETTSIL